jgi:hypothetical protein
MLAAGVGRSVVDLPRAARLAADLRPILIIAGHTINHDHGYWHVPKKELVSTLQILLQERRLTIAEAAVAKYPGTPLSWTGFCGLLCLTR